MFCGLGVPLGLQEFLDLRLRDFVGVPEDEYGRPSALKPCSRVVDDIKPKPQRDCYAAFFHVPKP